MQVTTCLKSVAATSSTNESLALLWLALSLTEGLGPKRGRSLVEHLGGIQNVFKASLTELEAAGIRAVSAQSLATGQSAELAQDELARVTAAGVSVVGLDDPTYPAELKQIYDPPLVLYVRGNVEAIAQPGVAVVGTRHPTPCGLGMAERLSCDLAARGLVIFSGLAEAWTRRRIVARSTPKGRRSPSSVQEWTSFIRRRTRASRNRF